MSKYLNLKPVEFDAMGKKNQASFKWAGRILLPKYDGCFAMVCFWNGNLDFILSRTGETVKSMDHIGEALLLTYPHLGATLGGVCILGEAWCFGKEFAEISGMFRRQRPQPGLGFAPFDAVEYEMYHGDNEPTLFSRKPYRERLQSIQSGRDLCLGVKRPMPVDCIGEEHARSYARMMKDLGGYDGAICSDPEATYTPGAGKAGEFIKLKPLLSYSLRVTGYESAVGEKTGRPTGALIVAFKGTTCKVATGLSEEQQANLADFVGCIIEVQCMGVYPGDEGLMREPRYIGKRSDVINPDY